MDRRLQMDNTIKHYFDLDDDEDAELIRDLIGELSELEEGSDDSDDDELDFQPGTSAGFIRAGADKVGKSDTIRDEPHLDDGPLSSDSLRTISRPKSSVTSSGSSSDSCGGAPEASSGSQNEASTSKTADLNDLLSTYFFEVEQLKKTLVARGNSKKTFTVKWEKRGLDDISDRPTPKKLPETLPFTVDDNDHTPRSLFSKYIPDSFFESASFFTNLYAVQQGTRRFLPSTADEIKRLVGLHIIMGNLKYPRVRMYWDSKLKLKVFPETMSRDRFFQLRTHLHMVDNFAPHNSNDRFFKVRPLYDSIRRRCMEMPLEEKLAIDEQMVPFRGNFNLLQYVKGKPCPWGIKIFFLCGKSGYPYDFIIYQGETTEFDAAAKKQLGMTASVVYTLAKRRIQDNSYHELYYDNYFSSYHLLRLLKKMNINAGGTIRLNRFFNPTLTPEKQFLKKTRGISEEVVDEFHDVVVVQWLDNKTVLLASNFVGIGEEDDAKRWDKSSRSYVTIKRPEIIKNYNHAMGGVDLLDQLVGLYRIFIRSRKWTLRMIFHGFEVAIVCAFKEYKKLAAEADVPSDQQYDLLAFRMILADQLIQSSPQPKKRGRPSSEMSCDVEPHKRKKGTETRPYSEVIHDQIGHIAHHDDKQLPTRCKNVGCCYKSHVFCLKCNVHLCLNKLRNCFSEFHKV